MSTHIWQKFSKKCHFQIISDVQWWTKKFHPFLHSTYQECMIFARIGDGPCYYLWNEICAGVPTFFYALCTGPAAQMAQKQKSLTTKSPLMQDWVFKLGIKWYIPWFYIFERGLPFPLVCLDWWPDKVGCHLDGYHRVKCIRAFLRPKKECIEKISSTQWS
jgi:hypothetical protein